MDGNGRGARAVGSWILFRRGFDAHHIFALDEFFEADRPRYYREIQDVREKDDLLTNWLEYTSEGVLEILRKTQQRIQALRSTGRGLRITLNATQERILQTLANSPPTRGSELARSLRITRSYLSKTLKPLVNAGLVQKDGSTKSASYRLKP
jgi:Fic family protein